MVTITVKGSIKCGHNYSLFVTAPYDTTLVDIFRSFAIRYYHPDTREWELPYKQLDELCSKLEAFKFQYIIDKNELKNKKITIIPNEYEFKTKPFNHQLEAIEYGLNHDKWLLGDSMGLGKTKVAIDLALIRKQQEGIKHCLIVCGVNGLKWNWASEIETHSDEDWKILGLKSKNSGTIKGNKDKLDDILNLSTFSEFFIITNIETFRNEKCALELRKSALNGELGMVILDEAHTCKNPSSQQGKGMLKLADKYMIAMTGTPLMNNPLDLYFIMKWLGYENHSYYAFKNHYCIMGGYGGYEIVGYKNMNEIKQSLSNFMIRRLKEDVFDLPDKIYVNEYVEMTPKQNQIYKEIKQQLMLNIDKIVTSPNPLSELIRLRQATGYTGILSSTIQESAKLDRMEELVEEAISNGQKVVIFSNWTSIIDAVINRLVHYRPLIITGETNDAARKIMVDRFQINDDYKVIVGTIGAMGTGITLTTGTVEIFLDEPWNRALKEQAVDRCHRIGTTENVTIYTLIAKGTIDEKINKIVEKKGLMADAIVDGKINMDKKELLNYLLI